MKRGKRLIKTKKIIVILTFYPFFFMIVIFLSYLCTT